MQRTFETLGVVVFCTFWGLSMHQSCTNLTKSKEENKKTEIKKVQELKNDTLNSIKFEQKVR